MFGNLMGDMQSRQEELRQQLAEVILTETAGAVSVSTNAIGILTNISIDKSKLDSDDMEELEDLLLVTTNRVLEKAKEKEAVETKSLMSSMLPPGMENILGGF